MATPYVGQIELFGFSFAPVGWAFCNGQLLDIANYSALFALIGTTYGGNGQTTFAVPNLQSRVPVHQGTGPGLSAYVIGQQGGAENVTLLASQMAAHSHAVSCANGPGNAATPVGNFPANSTVMDMPFSPSTNVQMNASMTGQSAGNQPHDNLQPYLALNYCIALEGVFPSRN